METIAEGFTRVSNILGQWDKFSGIIPEILENKRRIGTNVHEAIDMYNHCLPFECADDEQPYVDSYIRWHEEEKIVVEYGEERFYDRRLMITGKIDGVVKFRDRSQVVVCDWKTSYSADPLNWPMQGAFYRHLVSLEREPNLSTTFMFIKLDKHGELPKIYQYEYTEQLWHTCECAVTTYYYQKPWLDKRKQGFRDGWINE
jgi:hypothetical protein